MQEIEFDDLVVTYSLSNEPADPECGIMVASTNVHIDEVKTYVDGEYFINKQIEVIVEDYDNVLIEEKILEILTSKL